MLTLKDLTENCSYFCVAFIKFKSQSDVIYHVTGTDYQFRFSKADLIVCINHFLDRLCLWVGIDINQIKHGFVLDMFKYYELSVYLHGILQVYCNKSGLPLVGELYIKRFSRLPHDVLKPVKLTKEIQVAFLPDMCLGGNLYCCVVNGSSYCALNFESIQSLVRLQHPALFRKYNIVFNVK